MCSSGRRGARRRGVLRRRAGGRAPRRSRSARGTAGWTRSPTRESEGIGVRVLVGGAWGFACDRRLTPTGARDAALRACAFAAAAGAERRPRARAARGALRHASGRRSSATRSTSRSRTRSRSACAPRRRCATPTSRSPQASVRALRERKLFLSSDGRRDRPGARRVRRRHRRDRGRRDGIVQAAQLPERARRLERAGRLGVRRGRSASSARRRGSPRRRPRCSAPTSARRA